MTKFFIKQFKVKTVIKLLIIFCILALTSLISFVEYYTTNYEASHKLANLNFKLWSHAGYIENTNYTKNSIESFDNAMRNNAKGIEIDIIYDIAMKKIVVSHDYPYQRHNNKLLFLDSIFQRYQNNFVYWLDFKNLKDLEKKYTINSIYYLDSIIKKANVKKQNVLIESTELSNLSYFTKKEFYTSWWVVPYKSKYRSILRNFKYKLYFTMGKYNSLSMPYKYYGRVKEKMNNIPINLWTINNISSYKKNKENRNVKIILNDENWFSLE